MVLHPENIDDLAAIEKEAGKRVFTILQLRLHDAILAVKKKVAQRGERRYQVDLCYVPRSLVSRVLEGR
jgi:UDP-N-acetyl-2-amino-2-deoxyglucuronate dehydrogenase